MDLVRRVVADDDDLRTAFEHALRRASVALHAPRVSFWRFVHGREILRCELVFDDGRVSEGREALDLAASPNYASALATRRALLVPDVTNDSRVSELHRYFVKHAITATLDCPVFESGQAVGVLCVEARGGARPFDGPAKHFAATVADMLGLYLERASRERAFRQLEEIRDELEERRRMASLGRMAAATAHDFNNVLTAVALRTEPLRAQGADETSRAIGRDVATFVEQGRRLVARLQTFARQEDESEARTDLRAALSEVTPTLAAVLGHEGELTIDNEGGALVAYVTRSAIEQALINLARNAAEAASEGAARLTISLDHSDTDPFAVDADADDLHGWAVLRVRDEGRGMDDATRDRVFEPYFSTKSDDRAHGFGLATTYATIVGAGGSITVSSAPGQGAEFVIVLPLASPLNR